MYTFSPIIQTYIDTHLAVTDRELYLRWREGCELGKQDLLYILRTLIELLTDDECIIENNVVDMRKRLTEIIEDESLGKRLKKRMHQETKVNGDKLESANGWLWEPDDIKFVMENYETMPLQEISQHIGGRSIAAIKSRYHQEKRKHDNR